jgi:uncharacterized membrane protein YqgA involved in biofilm formation
MPMTTEVMLADFTACGGILMLVNILMRQSRSSGVA